MDQALEGMLRSWGYARRKINGLQPPPKSIMGKIVTWGTGASGQVREPESLEVMLNDSLIVARAIRMCLDSGLLKYMQFQVIFAHYVEHGKAYKKAQAMNISDRYYRKLKEQGKAVISPVIFDLKAEQELVTKFSNLSACYQYCA